MDNLNKSQPQAAQPNGDLPPLPSMKWLIRPQDDGTSRGFYGFDHGQMQDYARTAIAAHLARQSQPSTLGCAVPTVEQIAEAVLKMIGACVVEWRSGHDEEDEPFSNDEHERAHLCDMIRKYAAPAAQEVPPASEVQADEAELYRDLTGDAMALGFDGIPAALEALRAAGVAQEVTQQAAKADPDAQGREALPCPFCGSGNLDIAIGLTEQPSDYIMCNDATGCGAMISREDTRDGNLIAAWNRRAPTTSTVSAPGVQEPCAKLISHDGNGTATIMLTPSANVKVGTSLYLASPTSPDSSGQAEAQAVRDALLDEVEEAVNGVIDAAENDHESAESIGAYRCRYAIRALRTNGTGSAA